MRRWTLYGLEAISANNGWAVSVVGISIVFTGLVMLSLVISQLHKVIDLIENPEKIKKVFGSKKQASKDKAQALSIMVITEEQKEIAKQFALLVRTMEDHFPLPRLLRLAVISGIKDPHANLNILLKAFIIVADQDGYFSWDEEQFSQTISY
ncbi:MAG: OadG family protein [Desulfobacter sp.]|nr:OadG family protein [Desulfobacter sp.]WDP88010.1 MAG: OadG family protein [Desulfobacter sp.]